MFCTEADLLCLTTTCQNLGFTEKCLSWTQILNILIYSSCSQGRRHIITDTFD
jgi:hypothetical protein